MSTGFTAIFEKEQDWFIGYCLEVPGANGQGRTLEECRKRLKEAITLILEDRKADGLRGIPSDAVQETIELS